jgi:hypothetical protein
MADVRIAFETHTSLGVSRLFFVDRDGSGTSFAAVPAGVSVVDRKNPQERLVPIGGSFVLSLDRDYVIRRDDDLLYVLRRQRPHTMHGPLSHVAEEVQKKEGEQRTKMSAD